MLAAEQIILMRWYCMKKNKFRLVLALWLAVFALGCNRAEDSKPPIAGVQYLVVGEEKLTLSSTLPGRVSALVTA